MSENNILGVVLAGGKSKRFGEDKSKVKLNGKILLEHTLDKIKSKFDEIIIVTNNKIVTDYTTIEDCYEGQLGPLVGVLSAMKYANQNKKYNWIITFPCDTPFFDEIIIEKMIQKTSSKKEKIFLIKEKKQRHNIFGTWSTSLEKVLEQDLNNNFRKVDLWADKIGCSYIEKDIKKENEFLNINTKEDLELAEKMYNKK